MAFTIASNNITTALERTANHRHRIDGIVTPVNCGDFVLSPCFWYAVLLVGEEELVALFSIVFVMSCGCLYSLPLPHSVAGWSLICDCGISWSYELIFISQVAAFCVISFLSTVCRFPIHT